MTEVKRQHYVPRTYLRNFASGRNDEFYIKALPSDNCHEKAIYEVNVANICLEKDLYTLPGETEEQRMLIEKFYSENYEQHYNLIYQILTDDSKKTVTAEERELIIATVVTMLYRTTKWINQHNDFFNRVLENAYQMAKENGFDFFMYEKEKISIEDKTLEQLQKEYKYESRPTQVITQLDVALNLIKWRMERDAIMVVKLVDENDEFITSDNPVIYAGPKGKILAPFDAENMLQLPLDSKHILLLMPHADEENKLTIARSERSGAMGHIKKLTSNYSQFQNSERFLLGTELGLKGYLSTKEETEKPLSPGENKKFDDFDSELAKKLKELGLE